jgi:hypothetical protein
MRTPEKMGSDMRIFAKAKGLQPKTPVRGIELN